MINCLIVKNYDKRLSSFLDSECKITAFLIDRVEINFLFLEIFNYLLDFPCYTVKNSSHYLV